MKRRRGGVLAVLGVLWVFGIGAEPGARARSYVYVSEGTPLDYFPGTGAPDPGWADPGYVPGSGWVQSSAGFGIGYGDGDDQTVLSDMQGGYLTVYVRAHFTVGAELGTLSYLHLTVRYDDGFVAYLNGVEVGRAGLPAGAVGPDTPASSHEVTDGDAEIPLDPALLVSGENVLAVEVHNTDLGSSDLSMLPTLWGYDTPPPDADITFGPYLQQVGRQSALVVWETDVPVGSEVAYGGAPDALGQTAYDPTPTTHHVVTLTGLVPGVPTYYQVVSARVPSAVGRILPELDAVRPFRFVLFGDTRSHHDDHAAVVAAMAPHDPAFLVHTGDLVGDGTRESDWVTFFQIEGPLLRDRALYPVVGNHEGDGVRYLELFELPNDSPGGEWYYAFAYGPVGVVCLDLYHSDYTAGSAQATWLQDTLAAMSADPRIRLRIVALHSGPYDSGSHGSNTTVRSDLVPIFETNGVDVVVSGHDHHYERSTVNGIKYVVSGGGGAPTYPVSGDWWTEVAEAVLHYVLVEVEGPRATFTAYRLDGSVLDQFVLGDGLSECAVPADCASGGDGLCAAEEQGEWACVHGGCVWNCVAPGGPDGGVVAPDGGGADGGEVAVDGGIAADGGEPPGDGEDSGCGCHAAQGPGAPELLMGLLLCGWVWRRRRRVAGSGRSGR